MGRNYVRISGHKRNEKIDHSRIAEKAHLVFYRIQWDEAKDNSLRERIPEKTRRIICHDYDERCSE